MVVVVVYRVAHRRCDMASTIIGDNQVASRKESLETLKSVASSTDVSNDLGFQEILSMCQTILEMSDQQTWQEPTTSCYEKTSLQMDLCSEFAASTRA